MKAIFWDNDGVLVDTEILYLQATREVLWGVGIDLTDALYVEHFLNRPTGMLSLAEPYGLTGDHVEALRAKRNQLYSDLLRSRNTVLPTVRETLAQLHGKVRMAVVTSSRKDHFNLIHEKSGLLNYFEFVLASGDYEFGKPHPAPYLMALERSGLAPSDCLVVEDSRRGLLSAKAAGLTCWVIPTELSRHSDLSRADAILESIADIPARIHS